jgi:hypothetical protein
MAIEEHRIASLAELLERLAEISVRAKTVWFRGHADAGWKLEPTLSRQGKLASEIQLTKRFKQNAFQFLPHVPIHEWEWMFLMQHYGVPTRLLDWSENPLIAAYFATREDGFKKGIRKPEAALWCLFPRKLNEASGMVLRPPDDIPAFGDERELEDYLPQQVSQGISSRNPLAIVAPRQFGRVYAQQGVFTIIHKDAKRIEDVQDDAGHKGHLVKLRISRKGVHQIQKELNLLRVNKLLVFPQLENVAAEAIEIL